MKVIIFHGTECTNQTAWLPWLNHELCKQNIECFIPNLPTPKNQSYQTWSAIVDKIEINQEDVVVGWSTGAIFAVKYLFEHKICIKKLILISGFNNYVGNVQYVDNLNKKFFIQSIQDAKNVASEIVCIKSDNDPFISQSALLNFAKDLNARILNIAGGGHFNSLAGYLEFPQLIKEIL